MNRTKRLQSRITAGRFTLPVAILLSAVCWIVAGVLLPTLPAPAGTYPLWQNLGRLELLDSWAGYPISFLLYALIGYFLIALNNTYAIIRMRASVQTAIYILLVSVCPMLHPLQAGDVASVAFLVSLFFLFGAYQHPRPAGGMFYSFLFIGLGSLFYPQLTLFAPVLWLGAYSFQALTPRSFMGSLLGWWLPYWFLLGHAYYHDEMGLFCAPFIELATFQGFGLQSYSLWEVVTLAYLFLLFAVSSIHCLVAGYEDKIRTRSYLHFLIFLSLCIFGYILLQPSQTVRLLPVLLIGVSILTGHLVALTNSRASNVFFIFALVGVFCLFGFNVWMLL